MFWIIIDYKDGFGGKFGIQKDRVDKSAVASYEESNDKIGTNYEKTRPEGKLMSPHKTSSFLYHILSIYLISNDIIISP